ncbi:MAG: TIGR04372 family glycosyltransferase, partial [bacterium]
SKQSDTPTPSIIQTTLLLVDLWLKIKQKYLVVTALGPTKVVLLPFAMAFVGLLLFVSKFVRVRIHPVINSRIGHFATNTELSVLKIKERKILKGKREINIFCGVSDTSCSISLEKMWSRNFNFQTGNWGWLLNDISKRLQSTDFYQESTNIDKEGILNSFPPTLNFSETEMALGDEFLSKNNISNREKFVCLNVRDSSFLANSNNLGWSNSRDWSYHNYRDSDISTFVAATETLAEMDYTVFRMGAIVKEPLISKHPRVIDYATNGTRTDFLDIFLGAHCTFCVSTGSGWDSIPQIFRRPSLYVNWVPLFAHAVAVRDLLIYPKILQDNLTKNDLRLDEIIERNASSSLFSPEYVDAGVAIREMSSKELAEAVTEMAARVEGTFVETPEQKQKQAKLKHIFSTHPKLQSTPNYYPIRAEFASCFLSNYPNFFD